MNQWIRGISLGLLLSVAPFGFAQALVPNWLRELYFEGWDSFAFSVAASSKGVFVHSLGSYPDVYGRSASFVTKFDEKGVLLWTAQFDQPGQTAPMWSWTSVCSDGTVWVAAQFQGIDREEALVLRHLDQDGHLLATVTREFDADHSEDDSIGFQAGVDSTLTTTWFERDGCHYLRLAANGAILAESTLPDYPLQFAVTPSGEAYFGSLSGSSDLYFDITKINVNGEAEWKRSVRAELDWIGDYAGFNLAVADGALVATMGAYQDFPNYDFFWIQALKLDMSNGTVLARADLADPDRNWAPDVLAHPWGGSIFTERHLQTRVTRNFSDFRTAWTRLLGNKDSWYRGISIDRFGNTWWAGHIGSYVFRYSVVVWYADGRDRASHTLGHLDGASAFRVSVDNLGRAYVIGSIGQGSAKRTMVVQYPAQPSPVPFRPKP